MRNLLIIGLSFIMASQSLALALTENEIKYKWDKLSLVTITRSELAPTYKRYVGGYFSETEPKVLHAKGEIIEKWYITRGGQPISEPAFLRIVGEDKRAGAIIHWLCNGEYAWKKNDQEANRGTQAMAVGAALWLLNPWRPKDNYVPYDEAGYKIDLYNMKLRRELGLGEN
ncbi:hypothetical protein AMJ44_08745 [candidate division WOR-1 bacterium DG_54_3]|uniref:Uncharacterized protein n=1 Tax=candidate division WOR-1 bacterium DG_54_3 TaxID=1703775 RepID=A0A0S7XWA0_UNCSA|nr:MAG: hypothetical protein AMJ44_08745 [candidate division WOR-1 bacterium DG_54_3]